MFQELAPQSTAKITITSKIAGSSKIILNAINNDNINNSNFFIK